MVRLDPLGTSQEIMRSVLFFENGWKVFAGQEAINRYVDDVSSGRFMRSIKTLLPSESFTSTVVGRRLFTAVDLVAAFLEQLRIRAQEAGEEVDGVVIGRPVVFSKDPRVDKLAQDRLLQAALQSGFKEVSFQYEPIAAALLFETLLPPGESRTVLVGDFGGGTSDFTIMRVGSSRSKHRKDDILSLGGVYIGGDTFDSSLMWEKVGYEIGRGVKYRDANGRLRDMPDSITDYLRSWHTIPFLRDRRTREKILSIMDNTQQREAVENLDRLIEYNTGIALFQAVELAKCNLSTSEESVIVFDELKHPIIQNVKRAEFELFMSESIEQIESCVAEVVRSSGLKPEQIDNIFLAGGTSQIPCVRKIFERQFGRHKLTGQDAFTSVAFGLGVSAGTEF